MFFLFLIHLCYGSSEPFTIALLPDTQYYSSFFEEAFQEQTFWICECASQSELNIIFASHLGDVVHRGNKHERDWLNAGRAMHNLLKCDIPHGILPGNHDTDHRMTNPYYYFDKTFPVRYHKQKEWFGGSYDQHTLRNSYQLFETPDGLEKFVFVHLEYLPYCTETSRVCAWASSILDKYSDRTAFLSTHYAGSDCHDYIPYYVRVLIERHCNLRLIFGGHVIACGGERVISITNQCNQTSYSLISNYQTRSRGGEGWLRYYTFLPEEQKICAYTYSPILAEFETDENSYFSFHMKNMSLDSGCEIKRECKTHYASPGFVLASVWIASANIIFLYFLLTAYQSLPPQLENIFS